MKQYVFWKYDTVPYLLGSEVEEIRADGKVKPKRYGGMIFAPVLILPLKKGLKLQKKLDNAAAKYRRKCTEAHSELMSIVEEITQ